MAEETKKTFEESLNELEKVAQNLEKGDLSLEQAIAEFEKGMKLSKECSEKLEEAEKRIHILVQADSGEIEEKDFQVTEE